VATAKIPRGAVASELAKDGKKKTIFLDIADLAEVNDTGHSQVVCHRVVTAL
jgi:hypothetical protein